MRVNSASNSVQLSLNDIKRKNDLKRFAIASSKPSKIPNFGAKIVFDAGIIRRIKRNKNLLSAMDILNCVYAFNSSDKYKNMYKGCDVLINLSKNSKNGCHKYVIKSGVDIPNLGFTKGNYESGTDVDKNILFVVYSVVQSSARILDICKSSFLQLASLEKIKSPVEKKQRFDNICKLAHEIYVPKDVLKLYKTTQSPKIISSFIESVSLRGLKSSEEMQNKLNEILQIAKNLNVPQKFLKKTIGNFNGAIKYQKRKEMLFSDEFLQSITKQNKPL